MNLRESTRRSKSLCHVGFNREEESTTLEKYGWGDRARYFQPASPSKPSTPKLFVTNTPWLFLAVVQGLPPILPLQYPKRISSLPTFSSPKKAPRPIGYFSCRSVCVAKKIPSRTSPNDSRTCSHGSPDAAISCFASKHPTSFPTRMFPQVSGYSNVIPISLFSYNLQPAGTVEDCVGIVSCTFGICVSEPGKLKNAHTPEPPMTAPMIMPGKSKLIGLLGGLICTSGNGISDCSMSQSIPAIFCGF